MQHIYQYNINYLTLTYIDLTYKRKDLNMRVAFFTLGCKVNQYETQILMQQFGAQQFDVVEPEDIADVYVINSCTVTASGDKKTRQTLRKFKRMNPDAIVALTGCFPQAFPDVADKIPEADIITGSTNRRKLVDYVKEFIISRERQIKIEPHKRGEEFEHMHATDFHERTRAFVKIQDGCERYCSYCIIPYARGFVRSKPLDDLKIELLDLVKAGYQEVVLVGINLSTYGKDFGGKLVDAVVAACTTEGIKRVRLGSLEPDLLTVSDLDIMKKYEEFCPQFHLSLQSGCDETLKRMNRHYDTQTYRETVANIRSRFENSTITTDLMVGFAGETEEEFAKTCEFIKEIGFAKVHVFPYSIREGTRAAKMPNQQTRHTKEQRSHEMIALTNHSRAEFLKTQIGLVEEVLFETDMHEDGLEGYTKNYTPVRVTSSEDIKGTIRKVRITKALEDHCIGELI